MLDSVDLQKVRTTDGVKVLDEAVWQAWTAKSALRERQAAAIRLVAVKCVSIGILAAKGTRPRITIKVSRSFAMQPGIKPERAPSCAEEVRPAG